MGCNPTGSQRELAAHARAAEFFHDSQLCFASLKWPEREPSRFAARGNGRAWKISQSRSSSNGLRTETVRAPAKLSRSLYFARLALPRHFSDNDFMNTIPDWKIPKWPWLLANALLILAAFAAIIKAAHPISRAEIFIALGCVALGALLGCLPFFLDYRATGKLIEVHAVGTVAEQLRDLKKYSEQIAAATDQWARVQETTKGHAEKTAAAAREIAERMTEEIREFNEFQVKLNDTEKGALRLEVEKLRRTEGEWLQVVARILDHIFALHNAAARSGNPDLAEQISSFQNACRDATRRVGLTPFTAAPDEKFDAQKHRAHGVENPPATALVAETLAHGLTFQGRLLRPALVRLREADASVAATTPDPLAPEAE
jgi:molecular chaperone GrpE (heat shock protein)